MNKQTLCDALRAFINQRPGFDPRNYSDLPSYRADVRRATQQRADVLAMLAYVEARDGITAETIVDAARGTRLSIAYAGPTFTTNVPVVDYTTGQYWCTEYRAGVCRVLASAIWSERLNEQPSLDVSGHRRMLAYMFGRGLASRWFR